MTPKAILLLPSFLHDQKSLLDHPTSTVSIVTTPRPIYGPRGMCSCLCSTAAPAVCFKGCVAGVDATETRNEFSQLKFQFTSLLLKERGAFGIDCKCRKWFHRFLKGLFEGGSHVSNAMEKGHYSLRLSSCKLAFEFG